MQKVLHETWHSFVRNKYPFFNLFYFIFICFIAGYFICARVYTKLPGIEKGHIIQKIRKQPRTVTTFFFFFFSRKLRRIGCSVYLLSFVFGVCVSMHPWLYGRTWCSIFMLELTSRGLGSFVMATLDSESIILRFTLRWTAVDVTRHFNQSGGANASRDYMLRASLPLPKVTWHSYDVWLAPMTRSVFCGPS